MSCKSKVIVLGVIGVFVLCFVAHASASGLEGTAYEYFAAEYPDMASVIDEETLAELQEILEEIQATTWAGGFISPAMLTLNPCGRMPREMNFQKTP